MKKKNKKINLIKKYQTFNLYPGTNILTNHTLKLWWCHKQQGIRGSRSFRPLPAPSLPFPSLIPLALIGPSPWGGMREPGHQGEGIGCPRAPGQGSGEGCGRGYFLPLFFFKLLFFNSNIQNLSRLKFMALIVNHYPPSGWAWTRWCCLPAHPTR